MLLIHEGTITDRMCGYLEDDSQSLSANTSETWDLISFVLLLIALLCCVNLYRVLYRVTITRCDHGTG